MKMPGGIYITEGSTTSGWRTVAKTVATLPCKIYDFDLQWRITRFFSAPPYTYTNTIHIIVSYFWINTAHCHVKVLLYNTTSPSMHTPSNFAVIYLSQLVRVADLPGRQWRF